MFDRSPPGPRGRCRNAPRHPTGSEAPDGPRRRWVSRPAPLVLPPRTTRRRRLARRPGARRPVAHSEIASARTAERTRGLRSPGVPMSTSTSRTRARVSWSASRANSPCPCPRGRRRAGRRRCRGRPRRERRCRTPGGRVRRPQRQRRAAPAGVGAGAARGGCRAARGRAGRPAAGPRRHGARWRRRVPRGMRLGRPSPCSSSLTTLSTPSAQWSGSAWDNRAARRLAMQLRGRRHASDRVAPGLPDTRRPGR